MTRPPTARSPDTSAAISRVFRAESGRIFASLIAQRPGASQPEPRGIRRRLLGFLARASASRRVVQRLGLSALGRGAQALARPGQGLPPRRGTPAAGPQQTASEHASGRPGSCSATVDRVLCPQARICGVRVRAKRRRERVERDPRGDAFFGQQSLAQHPAGGLVKGQPEVRLQQAGADGGTRHHVTPGPWPIVRRGYPLGQLCAPASDRAVWRLMASGVARPWRARS